jgi:hypothetical protein
MQTDRGQDPNDRAAHLSDARFKCSKAAIETLIAISHGDVMVQTPQVSLLRGLGLVDSSFKLTKAGKEVLQKMAG